MRTLNRMMADLKVSSLDVLKVDIEGGEWVFLESVLSETPSDSPLAHVDQLLIETHFWPPTGETNVQRWLSVLHHIKVHGFKQFFHHRNPMSSLTNFGGRMLPCCYELSFFRTHSAQVAAMNPKTVLSRNT